MVGKRGPLSYAGGNDEGKNRYMSGKSKRERSGTNMLGKEGRGNQTMGEVESIGQRKADQRRAKTAGAVVYLYLGH